MSAGVITAEDARVYECSCGCQRFEVVEHESDWLLCCIGCSSYHPKARIVWIDDTTEAPRTPS